MKDPEASAAIGAEGERLAARFLRKLGCAILQRNCRSALGELDLIVRDGDEVVFVEVKTRSAEDDTIPPVTPAQQRRIYRVASAFALRHRIEHRTLRFDVISVLILPGQPPAIRHIKDAFSAPQSSSW